MRTDTPIAFRPSSSSTLDVSTKHPTTGPPMINKKQPPKSYLQSMAPQHRVPSRKPAPANIKTQSTRELNGSDWGDHSDSTSEHPKSSDQQDKTKSTRKRASKPKVRTGCISCKLRHVKCDERKPGCARCENLKVECGGYAQPRTTQQLSRAERPLLPRPQPAALASKGGFSLQPAGTQLPLLMTPGLGFDLAEDESWYFSLYRNKVAQDLSPCYRDNFWSRLPLRDSMTMNSIRHSVLSIGAYARALAELRNEYPMLRPADHPWWPVSIFNRHREAALNHHAQALMCLRQEIGTAGVDNRTTMLATLLFIVFENMMGNYHSSGNMVRSGIKVLNNMGRTRSRKFIWRTYCGAFDPPNDIDEMAHIFLRHSITSVLLPFPHGKSAYHMLLDDDYDDDDPLNDTGENISILFGTQANIPRTIEHARAIWETIFPTIGKFYAKALWRNLNPNYEVDDGAFIDQAFLVARLHDIGIGLAALVATETNEATLQSLTFLQAHHGVANILIACCLDRTEVSYDSYTAQFIDALEKCRALSNYALFRNETGFTNEVAILPLIGFIASKCRVHTVRLDALDLLRNSRWREGPWDGVSLTNAVSNLMQLEGQSDQDDGTSRFSAMPEIRYVWTNMFWDFEHRQMTIEYTKAWSDEPGDLEKVVRVVGG